jgi:intracellular septation protein A
MWLVTFVPLLIFVIVDFFSGLRSGVVAAVIVALASVGALWIGVGIVDWEALFAVGVMTVCGWAAVRTGNPVIFKLQPVITSGVVVLYLAYCQFFATPFLIRTWPVISQLMPPESVEFLGSPEGQQLLSSLSLYLIIWTVAHVVLVAWAALRKGNVVWIVIKGLGVPFILVGSLITIVAKGVLGG